jgi:hypothetical protein
MTKTVDLTVVAEYQRRTLFHALIHNTSVPAELQLLAIHAAPTTLLIHAVRPGVFSDWDACRCTPIASVLVDNHAPGLMDAVLERCGLDSDEIDLGAPCPNCRRTIPDQLCGYTDEHRRYVSSIVQTHLVQAASHNQSTATLLECHLDLPPVLIKIVCAYIYNPNRERRRQRVWDVPPPKYSPGLRGHYYEQAYRLPTWFHEVVSFHKVVSRPISLNVSNAMNMDP